MNKNYQTAMKQVYGGDSAALTVRRISDEKGIIPRTLSKKALRSYFGVTKDRYDKIITQDILDKMNLTVDGHKQIREYNLHQTRIIIENLQLSRDELVDLGRLM